jgi:predicted GH43/DUF377 family glycosyl hydrolase
VKRLIFISWIFCFLRQSYSWIDLNALSQDQKIITAIQEIKFPEFPYAHNPSIIKNNKGFLLTFRYVPDPIDSPWVSYIGVVQLDTGLNPISAPALLNTRAEASKTPSQAEDARFFSYKNRIFLIYNDNLEVIDPTRSQRRDMFITELFDFDGNYELSIPLKLIYPPGYDQQLWQKNWTPFVYNDTLYLSYSINPHLILLPNLKTGECYKSHETSFPSTWIYGPLRGSSNAILMDGEYLSFFHSAAYDETVISWPWVVWHYFMGAYTFATTPPFSLTRMTDLPILTPDLYTISNRQKRVVFPGGFIVCGSSIYVAYGKDDCEIWMMTLDKEELKKALKPIQR